MRTHEPSSQVNINMNPFKSECVDFKQLIIITVHDLYVSNVTLVLLYTLISLLELQQKFSQEEHLNLHLSQTLLSIHNYSKLVVLIIKKKNEVLISSLVSLYLHDSFYLQRKDFLSLTYVT